MVRKRRLPSAALRPALTTAGFAVELRDLMARCTERGVDPVHQVRAIERATALMLQIAGGEAGPVVITEEATHLPQRRSVT